MKIGRKDDNDRSGSRPPAADEGGGERPPSASFDWSKVKGAGAPPGSGASASSSPAPIKKERRSKKTAEGNDERKFVWPLSPKETYAAAGIAVLFLGIIYFVFLRGDPSQSASSITTLELQQMSQSAAKEMTDNLAKIEKEFGKDNPEAQQQREMLKQLKIAP